MVIIVPARDRAVTKEKAKEATGSGAQTISAESYPFKDLSQAPDVLEVGSLSFHHRYCLVIAVQTLVRCSINRPLSALTTHSTLC